MKLLAGTIGHYLAWTFLIIIKKTILFNTQAQRTNQV